jgi:fumarate hydratase class I
MVEFKYEELLPLGEDDTSYRLLTDEHVYHGRFRGDPDSSDNDRYVALEMLKNAVISAEGEYPMCQDTGTAIVMGKKGQQVWTGDAAMKKPCPGRFQCLHPNNLRYSQNAPLTMFEEKNTGLQPAGPDRAVCHRRRCLQISVHRQGRRVGQQDLPVPGNQGGAESRTPWWRS